jgi:hypothetical protein
VKSILLVITPIFFLAGCSWFDSAEEYKSEPGRTIYRAPAGSEIGDAIPTPPPQKVPGESH